MADQAIAVHITAMSTDIGRTFPSQATVQTLERWVRWCSTLPNSVVVNVDESVLGTPSRGGYGGCLRTFARRWIRGFFGFDTATDILCLELMAIFRGLVMAWDMGYRVVECQSDSLDAVNLALSPPIARHLYEALLLDIRDMLERPWTMKLGHTLREGNACTDHLTKHGASQEQELVLIEHPLPGLSGLLLTDELGVSFLRR